MSRPMKDSGIAWVNKIPSDWDIHPLYYYFAERNRPNRRGKENNLLSLSYGKIIKKDINICEGLLPASYNSYNIIDPLDIVLRLTDLQNDKRSLRTGLSHERGIITSAYVTLKPSNRVCPAFFHYLLHAYDVEKVLYNMGNGVRQSLNYAELSKLPLLEPSLQEQQRIAGYLDKKCAEVEGLSSNIQKQIEALEQYKRAVITETVTKGLNPSAPMKDSGIPWIGQIPAHWNLNKLKYVTTKLERGTSPDYTDEELTRVVNQATFSRGFFNDKDTKFSTKPAAGSRGLLKRHDVLLASTGGGVLGKTHFFDEVETYVADGHVTIARANEKKILSKLLYYLFFTNFDTFNALMTKGSTNQTELQSLDLANMFIPVPPLSEQQQIVQVLDRHTQTIARAIHSKQQQLEKLEQYKKAIIFEYVTGKKQVPEA